MWGIDKNSSKILGVNTEDEPDNLECNRVYIVGQGKLKWVAIMKCPCGCNEIIYLNLLKETFPSWKIIKHRNRSVSIKPSIRRIIGCKSHFWLRKGKILWVFDDYLYD